jgi:tetratricopeptide (TPR) repeat protein
LSRGNQPPRPLGSIPELEPFFTSSLGSGRGMQSVPRTLHGVAPPPSGAPRPADVKNKPTQRGFGLPAGSGRDASFSSTQPAQRATGEFEQHAAPSRVLGVDPAAETERLPESPSPSPTVVKTPVGVRTAAGLGMGSTQRSGTPPSVSTKPGGRVPTNPGVAPQSPPPGSFAPMGSTVRMESSKPSFDSTLPAASPPRVEPGAGRVVPPVQVRTTPLGDPRVEQRPAGRGHDLDATMQVPQSPRMPPQGLGASPQGLGTSPQGFGTSPQGLGMSATVPSAVASAPMPPSPKASSPRAAPTPAPAPVSTRARVPSYDDLPEESVDPSRRARSRWIAGVVFVAVVGLLGATLGRQYLVRLSTGRQAEPARRDDRAARFLQEGTRLIDQADYDLAQEQLVKAQALSERDPAVLAALARLETARADLVWLKLRLLDPTSKDLVQATTRDLTRLAGRARQAADAAFAVVADDPVVVRARVDAMRIAGEEAKAREWIAPIAAHASDAQNAYVLAALDLSEAAPAFGTVIDRLRAAAVSERESARARGALIYALVRAGRVVEAETELAKIAGASRPHPLAEELKSFVARFSAPVDGGAAAPSASAPLTGAAGSSASAATAPASGERSPGSADALPAGDFRVRLTQAAQASSSGDLARAAGLYQSVLSEQPGNTEALSGLADVARRRGDAAGAASLYARVLENNPSYLPALMATADQKWASGDRKGALGVYRRILEQAGPSTDYGQRAQARISEGEGASAPAAPKPGATGTATSESPAPERQRPDIDVSDLPGVTPP